jgi:oxalate decarboxylase
MANTSRHVASLIEGEVIHSSELGSITSVTAETLPILRNLSIKRLLLAPGTIREPHWHANANELTYCVSGSVLVSVLDTGSVASTFTIEAGQMFHIPSGSLHHIENVGDTEAELIVAFRHERPEDFSLWSAFGAMSDAVLGNTYSTPASVWAAVPRDVTPRYLVARPGDVVVPDDARRPDPHKFDVEGQSAPVDSPVGSAKLARQGFWPALQNISMYSLRVKDDGMREPHWHPVTSEMGYIHQGRARMTILDPDGRLDTYTLEPGDVYFVPASYPHHIEVLGDDDIHFLVFFDQATPADIGYRASASAYSAEVLAATFGVPLENWPALPFTPSDPLIVAKVNPTDPE